MAWERVTDELVSISELRVLLLRDLAKIAGGYLIESHNGIWVSISELRVLLLRGPTSFANQSWTVGFQSQN